MVERFRPRTPEITAEMPKPRAGRFTSTRASIKKSTMDKVTKEGKALRGKTVGDSFQNFALNLGQGTNNALSQSSYGFNPITRIRTMLEWIHRGSWLGGMAIDLLADDMTRGGVEIITIKDPTHVEKMQQGLTRLKIWSSLRDTVAWGNLYGGCLAVILIDGQNPETPLRIETVGKNKFKGLMVLDRWQVDPDLQHLVSEYGPHLGLPEYYRVVADAPAMRGERIHYTRCIRLEGIRLPYWQRIMENLWGLSIFERLYDRMVAFDSATTGAAQLVYKSFLRTYKIDGLHDAATTGGDALNGIAMRVELMRKYQGIEGITLLDGKDDFTTTTSSGFTGIGDILLQFAEQLSGALQIPLVRLLGQSPAGLNSTGESDLRTYYDGILQRQERDLREGVNVVLRVLSMSLGIKLPDEFGFNFVPLWQLDETEKSEVSDRDVKSVLEVEAAGLISEQVALKEIRQLSRTTGRFTNITDEMIEQANDIAEPPEPEGAVDPETGEPLPPGAGGGEEGGEEGGQDPEGSPKPGEKGKPSAKGAGGKESSSEEELKGLANFKKLRSAVGAAKAGSSDSRARLRRVVTRDLESVLPLSEIGGLQVAVEQRAGTIRRGEGWSVVMPADYGYIRRVGSAEGEQEWLDCFIGPARSSREVWIVDALNPTTGEFDEHKVMLGFNNSREAIQCFKQAFNDGAVDRIGAITHLSMDSETWKTWLAEGDKTQPLTFRSAA